MVMETSWNASAGVPSCSFAFFELKKYPSLKLGAFFILSYITIIFYSFLLVWITLPSWHIVMQLFEVLFSVSGYHIYQAYTMIIQIWCHFQPNKGYILNATEILEIVYFAAPEDRQHHSFIVH